MAKRKVTTRAEGDTLIIETDIEVGAPTWTCYLFGYRPGTDGWGIVWYVEDHNVPNAWVRFWMRVFLGCRWERRVD